jgi:hypothetical protein
MKKTFAKGLYFIAGEQGFIAGKQICPHDSKIKRGLYCPNFISPLDNWDRNVFKSNPPKYLL